MCVCVCVIESQLDDDDDVPVDVEGCSLGDVTCDVDGEDGVTVSAMQTDSKNKISF